MDVIDILTVVMIAIPVALILSKISLGERMKKVYVEGSCNEVKRIRA